MLQRAGRSRSPGPTCTYGRAVPSKEAVKMTKMFLLTIFCGCEVVFAAAAFGETARTKVVSAARSGQPAPRVDSCRSTFACRQDLFDRDNRNNLRFDWPSPPAQAGQF